MKNIVILFSFKRVRDVFYDNRTRELILFYLFFKIYLFTLRQMGREGQREGEKYQCVVASGAPRTGDLARNPGMCADWESNWRPFGSQPVLNPLSYTSQGQRVYFRIDMKSFTFLPSHCRFLSISSKPLPAKS